MSVVIVVAKYKEDISWVNMLRYPYIVYDKSKDIPNVGREAETYLRYIIANYETLPDYVVLLQGNPFDHLSKLSVLRKRYFWERKVFNPIENAVNYVNQSIANAIANRRDVVFLNDPYTEPHDKYTRTRKPFMTLFNHPLPNTLLFPIGAQYIVSRESILCRSKHFYETISNVMSTVDNKNPLSKENCLVCPWTMERMWPYIFNKSIPNKDITYKDLI